MNGSRSAGRVRQEIVRLCHAGLDSRTFRVESVRRLQKAIPVDASFFATADPATLLFTGAVLDDVLASATAQFLENEFMQEDAVKFARLVRGRSPVDSLGAATRGELVLSPRYQEILAPMDLGDELRAALVVGSKCWGFMCLHRERSSPNFTPAEAALLARLAPHLAEGLRAALLLGDSRTTTPQPDGPGLVLLADDLSLVAITPAAEGWLAEVEQSDWRSSLELPNAVYAVAARLLALERGGHTARPYAKGTPQDGLGAVAGSARLKASSRRHRGADSRHLRGGPSGGDRASDSRRLRPNEARGRDNQARPARALHGPGLRGVAHHAQHRAGSLQGHLRQGRRAQQKRTRWPGLRPALPATHGDRSGTRRRWVVHLSCR